LKIIAEQPKVDINLPYRFSITIFLYQGMSMENLDPVKLLVTFSYDANLDEIIATLT
jgi:hypothetical protein